MTEREPDDVLVSRCYASGPQPGQAWRHAKTGRIYAIVCRSLRESDRAPLVTYQGLGGGVCWTRTLLDFTAEVDVRGARVPRFHNAADWE